ncbi:MAG: diguanylate cyclase, partial [bacterium]|nr:diguanylate cyclase [bacterium]
SAVNAVAFSPGDKLLASGSTNGTVRIWAVASGREIRQLRGRAARVSALALGRGGRTLAVGVEDESLLVWSLGEEGENRIPAPSRLSLEDTSALRSVAVSADGVVVAMGFLDGTVAVWEAGSIRHSERYHVDAISSLALSPQAVQLASASQERVVIWDLTNRRILSDLEPNLGTPSALAWNGDGKLAIGTRAGRVGIWNGEEMKPIREGFLEILSLAFPAGDEVWVLQRDRTFHRWNLATGEVRRDGALAERLSNVAMSPDGEFLTAVRIGERIVRLGRRGESYSWSHRFLGGAAPGHLWIGCAGPRCWRYDDGTLLLREQPSGELSAVLPPGTVPTPQVEFTAAALLEVTAGDAAPLTVEVTNRSESPVFWIALRQATDADSPLIFHPPPVVTVLEPGETTRLRCRVSVHLAHDDPRAETFSLRFEAVSAGGPLSAPDPIAITVRTPSLQWDGVRLYKRSITVAITNVGHQSLPPTRVFAEFPEWDVTSELKTLPPIATGESRAVSLDLPEKIDRGGTANVVVETAQHPIHRWTLEKPLGLQARPWRVGLLIGVTLLLLLLLLFLWLHNRKRRQDRPDSGTPTAGPDLQAFSDLLQTSVDREEVYRIVEARMSRQIFPELDGALLVLADDNQLRVRCRWEGESSAAREMFEREDCLALRKAKTAVVDRDARSVCRHVERSRGSYVCVPLQARGRTHGVLHLMSRNPELVTLPPATLETAQAAAREIARTLARLSELEQTWRDELTGLLDRRLWNDQLEQRAKRLLEEDVRFGVMMMDIDHFAEFNKQHGHPAGDEILREIGKLLLSLPQEQDVVCRYGGEEFLFLMPKASLKITRERAEQLRREVQHRRPQGPEGQSLGPVTLSFGVASFPEHGGSWSVILAAADSALRRAKAEGRNRVAVASGADEGPVP